MDAQTVSRVEAGPREVPTYSAMTDLPNTAMVCDLSTPRPDRTRQRAVDAITGPANAPASRLGQGQALVAGTL